jgi:hypothetical protein
MIQIFKILLFADIFQALVLCQILTTCNENPCKNNAHCFDSNYGYTCKCTNEYVGRNCEIDIRSCDTSTCDYSLLRQCELDNDIRECEILNGAIAYPKCKDAYNGVGPLCMQNCPQDFRDDGAFCAKPEAYGRGAGYIDLSKCEADNGQDNCEKYGLLFYPKCKSYYHDVGCCIW